METGKNVKIARRKFLLWLVPIGSAVAGLLLFKGIYTNTLDLIFTRSIKRVGKREEGSGKRSPEGYDNVTFILNAKTNVAHLRSKKLFTYYDRIKDVHVMQVDLNTWETTLADRGTHFRRGVSGVIFENLSLKNLSAGMTSQSLDKSITIISSAFSKEYHQYNTKNWRLYDLLLKYLALKGAGINESWAHLSEIIKLVDFTHIKIPRKNAWLRSRSEFEKRIEYIINNQGAVIKKLQNRILV